MCTEPTGQQGVRASETWETGAEQGCERYLRHLSEYVDGALSEALCHEIEAHMAECENCRVVVNTLNKTVALYRRLPAPELPHSVREQLYRVLHLEDFYRPPDAEETR